MGELGLNKIFGALLATALGIFALQALASIVFSSGHEGGHGEEHAEATSLTEQMCEKFAYCVEVAGSGGGAVEEEEVFDLGLLLASADIARGERTFKGQCTTCHTIESGGANGTGPNLHNVVGADIAAHAGFNYSGALSGLEGTWTYEALNDWLTNPAAFARGTSMSFAGLRRDADRINVIAYLAANTENAPAFPDPLPAASEEPAPEEGVVEGEANGSTEGEGELVPAEAPVEGAADAVEAIVEDAGTAADDIVEAAEEAAGDAADMVEDVIEEASEEVTDATDGEH